MSPSGDSHRGKWVNSEFASLRCEATDFDKEAEDEMQDLLDLLDESQQNALPKEPLALPLSLYQGSLHTLINQLPLL